MSRSEARTADAWRSYDRTALGVAALGLLALLVLWLLGYGPNQMGCCAVSTVATPAAVLPVAPPATVAALTPEPVKAEPPKVEPPGVAAAESALAPVDCSKLAAEGVTVNFAFASAVLDPQAHTVLDEFFACLNEGRFEVAGHTSSVGDITLNQRLSVARAQAVVAYLVGKGLPASRFVGVGLGQTKPIANNDTDEGRAKNRRATLTRLP
ncbi:MAG: OmpA family protein [Burkholderiaceae bacterium]